MGETINEAFNNVVLTQLLQEPPHHSSNITTDDCIPISILFQSLNAAGTANTRFPTKTPTRAPDLVRRMGDTYQPTKRFLDYDEMLADPDLEAVVIATAVGPMPRPIKLMTNKYTADACPRISFGMIC